MGRHITNENRLPKGAMERLQELQVEDPRIVAILNRCWGNRKYIEAGVAMVAKEDRAELLAPRQSGWRATAAWEYENYYNAALGGNEYGMSIRELTTWLKDSLILGAAEVAELGGIRRAARGRAQRGIEKEKREGH
ncbi:hypothetical protein [Geomonas agri]|uniref:hypothetical protein n=1 Tax=Geomonas agri TaxID=2873702 RepID=UPI001CD6C6D3|nr:hypothetical protein [Geomonas agri]